MIPQPGDILLFEKMPGWRWGSWAPFLVRLITGNKVIHVGLVVNYAMGKVYYWDSNPGGVKRRILDGSPVSSNDLLATKVARLHRGGWPSSFDVRDWAWPKLGNPYSYRRIFNLAILHLVRQWNPGWAPKVPPLGLGNPAASICSDFVARWLATRSEVWGQRPEWTIEPDDFLDPKLFHVSDLTIPGGEA